MTTSNQSIAALRDKVRAQARTSVKAAGLGGEQDMPFEQAFSNLAHAYLKDKAPSLLDYEIGFQLVDRNQENTKAIGVFGFKIGPQWIYAPVFFLNGDLKGHELLYIKNQDMFVPLKENWLNYILNRKPSMLGSSVDKDLQQIGVTPPHLYQLARSPHKFASALDHMSPWARDIMPAVAHWATSHPGRMDKYKDMADLPTFLKKEGKEVVRALLIGFQQTPKLASAFDEFHGLAVIDDVMHEITRTKESKSVLATCAPLKKKQVQAKSVLQEKVAEHGDPFDPTATYALEHKLKIIVYDDALHTGDDIKDLNGEEREKLVADKVLIKDERPHTEVAYEVTSPVHLQNPTETGLYDVLVKENKFEKCLVVFAPYCQRGRKDFVVVVRLDGSDDAGRAWLNTHPSQIWTNNQYSNEEYQKWWDALPDAKDLSVSRSRVQLLIGNTGAGTLPFTVDREISGDTRKIYDVWFKNYASKERADHLPPLGRRQSESIDDGSRIQFTGKRGASLRATGGDLYVPADYKKLVLKPGKKDDDNEFSFSCCDDSSDPAPIRPGNQLDIDFLLGTKTAAVKMFVSGTELVINDKRMQKVAALVHLVRDWGFREKLARELIRRAEVDKVCRFRVKKATQTYPMQQSSIHSPGIPATPTGFDPMSGGMVPTQNLGEWNVKIPELSAANTNREIYRPLGPDPDYQRTNAGPDRHAQETALQASRSGQREIFDTTMIGSLLKAVRDDSMIDRYMGDLMKGLDRLGRILFLFYWHGDKFQERYGKGDMIELEDGIRNSFEYLGDLVLFLKQRAVDKPDEEFGVDLSAISGS